MLQFIFPKRFSLAKYFAITYIVFAFIIRLALYFWSFNDIDFSIINFLKIIGIGLFFDLGSLSYIIAIYAVYLLIFPKKYYGKIVDKILNQIPKKICKHLDGGGERCVNGIIKIDLKRLHNPILEKKGFLVVRLNLLNHLINQNLFTYLCRGK